MQATKIKTTAGRLAFVLYGCTAADMVPDGSWRHAEKGWCYRDGDSIWTDNGVQCTGHAYSVRTVPEDASVTLSVTHGGGRVVEDEECGWIADRFNPLGHRETMRAAKWLAE